MLLKRSYEKELMDDTSISDFRVDTAYKELHTINKFLGGISVTREGIKFFGNSGKAKLKILDVGGGVSDILHDLNSGRFSVFSLDLNKYVCHCQKMQNGNNNILCADALNLPVKPNSFDLVHSSLFFHHLKESDIVRLLNSLMITVKKGIIINELRRNIFALIGIWFLTSILSHSEFVKYDAPMSVKRSFTKKELINIFRDAGIRNFIIKRKWAFRFLILIPASDNEK
jgi:ubiquinone/menaquinone biosynthesis C-methylase UbiE